MDGWRQILETYPILLTIWDTGLITLGLAALLAYSGIFFLSSAAKILSVTKRRLAYDKCSRQIALLGLGIGWFMLVAGRVWLYVTQGNRAPGTLENFMFELSWMLFSLGVLLSSVYYTFWRILKNMPVLHSTLGMISAAQNCLALAAILFSMRLASIANPGAKPALPGFFPFTSPTFDLSATLANTQSFPEIFPPAWDAPLWSAAAWLPCLILAMAGAWAACWLVIRRRRDDFGRDYYNTMLPWCVAWARNAWLCFWILLIASYALMIWKFMNGGDFNSQTALLESIRLLIWLAPAIFWIIVRKSAIAMRQSWLLFIALLIAICFMPSLYLQIVA